ncbi:Acetylornithine deacetylase [bioreactor metagenome]|uniref:Acetylornithine deacetylase n=1 Tax=bioreactor metagenome TaxID=1076179 RepID=A0A645BUW8_9ZZZZ
MNEYFRVSRLILEKLIATDTSNPPGSEQPAAEYLAEFLTASGFTCTMQMIDTGRTNLIAELRKGVGPSLLYNGHLDVVPACGNWSFPPFQLTERDGKLYGRGSCDMKSGVAAMCAAAACMAKNPFSGTLRLLFVADEERRNRGAQTYLQHYAKSDYTVIGEPTNLHVAVAHRGICRDYITFFGKATHAALVRDEGCNSVLMAAKAVLALEKLSQKLECCRHPILPSPSVAVTLLEGYESENIIPARVKLLTDFRIHPGTTLEEAQEIVRKTLQDAGLEDFEIANHFFLSGGQLDEHDPFVTACCRIAAEISGQTEIPRAFGASCEQCFFEGKPTLICGPGSMEQAHTVDEYVQEEQLYRAVEFYIRLAEAILK